MRVARPILMILTGWVFAAPGTSGFPEPDVPIPVGHFVGLFAEYCLSDALDLAEVAETLDRGGSVALDDRSVRPLFAGVVPHDRAGYVVSTGSGALTVLLAASGPTPSGTDRTAPVTDIAETLPILPDSELPDPLGLLPEGAVGYKHCAAIARTEGGGALPGQVQALRLNGRPLSQLWARQSQTGPTGQNENAYHWFASFGETTINVWSRPNADGTLTARLELSSLVFREDDPDTYRVSVSHGAQVR